MNKPTLFHIRMTVPPLLVDSFVNLLENISENVSWDVSENYLQDVNIDAFVSNKETLISLTQEHLAHTLAHALQSYNLPQPNYLSIEEIPEKNWLLENQLSFPPINIGSFFIHGSHFKHEKPQNKLSLEINAALAFGSGEHASTKGCLTAISSLDNFKPQNGLDVGCGSGILAMAASLFFKIPILAIDIDPFSVETTKENAKKNNLENNIICFQSNGYEQINKKHTFDLILCNILAKPLCEMAPQLKQHLSSNGIAILSGLLNTQSQEVVEQHQTCGLELINTISMGEWETLIFNNA
jgi:ribosomal protein L11 methyltransferase